MTDNTTRIPDAIDNCEDYIDSRDAQERIDYLAQYENALEQDEQHELDALRKLKEQYIDYYGAESWEFGAQFIRDSYMVDYAQELAEDIGAVKEGMSWPNNCIDWEQAARELAMDYTEVEFDGVTYYTREA